MNYKEIETKEYLLTILDEYFSNGKKFIDVNRIPLICQDISTIHADIKGIKNNITWTVRTVLGALIAAIIYMLFHLHS